MRCFSCSTGGDQVFYSALSATDPSRWARSASVTLQLEIWSPSSIDRDRKQKGRVNERLKDEKPEAHRAFWRRGTLCCLFLGRLFLPCLQIRAMLSSKLQKIKGCFLWCVVSWAVRVLTDLVTMYWPVFRLFSPRWETLKNLRPFFCHYCWELHTSHMLCSLWRVSRAFVVTPCGRVNSPGRATRFS